MSIYDKASLVLIPSGTKTSKVYSQKPTNGDGDFTFSRSTAATRVNASGNIEKETQNLLKYSQDFSNANWVLQNNATISHNITDPNGGTTASRLTFDALTNSGIYQQDLTNFGSNLIRTASVYLKGSVGGENVMIGDATNRTRVTLTTDWVRYEGFAVDNSTFFIIYTDHISGSSADTIDIAFAQYETSIVARDYIETTTAAVEGGITDNVPRLDYTDSSCPALLLEPQRTNLVTQSEYQGSSDWSKTNVSVTSNAATSPQGVSNATEIIENSSTAQHFIGDSLSLTSGTAYSVSVYAKKNTRSVLQISPSASHIAASYANYDLENGVVSASGGSVTTSIEDAGDGWYRCVLTFTATSTATATLAFFMQTSTTASRGASYAGDGSSSLYVYGFQVEAGTYPTSYIPTYGSAVTRNQDEFSIANQPQLFGDSEGTLFIDRSALGIYDDYSNISLNSGNFTNSLGIRYNPNGNSILAQCRVNNANEAFLNHSVTDITDRSKAAFGYKTNDFVFYVDGSSVGTETSGNTFPDGTITHMKSSRGDADDFFYGRIYQILVFTTRLTNAELADLTTL